jgi:phospholipid/cholesterol/gamma-HCH transport system permease protein
MIIFYKLQIEIMKMIYFIIRSIETLGLSLIYIIVNIGTACVLLKNCIFSNIFVKREFKNFIRYLYFIGVLSLGIIILSGFFIGMVVGLQGHYMLKNFGTENIIGQMTSLTIIRELGPVVSALLFSGRTGASLTAEICLMKNTDQLLSMEMMGIDPIKKVIAPRFWAGIISMIFLSIIFISIAILGSFFSTVYWLNIDHNTFWISIRDNINLEIDILKSIIKSFLFGLIIIWISIYQGISSISTVESIAISTTNTVVYSSCLILILNFFLTSMMFQWN